MGPANLNSMENKKYDFILKGFQPSGLGPCIIWPLLIMLKARGDAVK